VYAAVRILFAECRRLSVVTANTLLLVVALRSDPVPFRSRLRAVVASFDAATPRRSRLLYTISAAV
jgi:hypothetical protein